MIKDFKKQYYSYLLCSITTTHKNQNFSVREETEVFKRHLLQKMTLNVHQGNKRHVTLFLAIFLLRVG